MAAAPDPASLRPIDVGSQEFADGKYETYRWLREQAPVHRGRVSIIKFFMVSRYDDCLALLRDPRFVRNRATARGKGSRFPIPLPRTVALMAQSMILEDEPEHRRLRNLVKKAFTPAALAGFDERIDRLTHRLLDEAEKQGRVDLMPAYSLPIPTKVISDMVGVSDDEMPRFKQSMRVLTQGFSGWRALRTLLVDIPGASRFVRELIARKREDPQDDILSGLIQAEEDGDRLSEDEIVSMVFLLLVAGYETTVHLINNGVVSLLEHPEQLARLRAQPDLIDSAVEEILRYRSPVQGTKMSYACEDVVIAGTPIPKGSAAMPLLGSANMDPAAFDDPDTFDIARNPNRHLAFSHGTHFCLGAQLARLETKIALRNLIERNPNLRLAVPASELRLQTLPMWHRYESVPVELG